MPSNIERYTEDLKKLIAQGNSMLLDLTTRSREEEGDLDKKPRELSKRVFGSFEENYQRWYSESNAVVRQLLPERIAELEALYKGEGRRKTINIMTYTIQDWLMGVRTVPDMHTCKKPFDDLAETANRFRMQLDILKSVEGRFESRLFDIKQLVQADLLDSELEASRSLSENLHPGYF